MSLVLAFGLTALFFIVIWLFVLVMRVVGLRRRIEGFDTALAQALDRVESLRQTVIGEADFASAPVQAGDMASLVRLLRASGQEGHLEQAELLSDLDAARRHVETERERALLEFERLLSQSAVARMAAKALQKRP